MSKAKKPFSHVVEEWEEDLIEKHSLRFRRKFNTTDQDIEDIEQMLFIYVTKRKDRVNFYDLPHEMQVRLLNRWLDRKVCKIKRSLKSHKRQEDLAVLSLTEPLPIPRMEFVLLEDTIVETRTSPEAVLEARVFNEAFEAVLSTLKPFERRVVEELMKGRTKTQVARMLRVHRDTVYEAVKKIRMAFRKWEGWSGIGPRR